MNAIQAWNPSAIRDVDFGLRFRNSNTLNSNREGGRSRSNGDAIAMVYIPKLSNAVTCTDYKTEFSDTIFCRGEKKTYHQRHPCHCIDERL